MSKEYSIGVYNITFYKVDEDGNDLLAETIEELGQSLTELQQVFADIKEQVNYREEDT